MTENDLFILASCINSSEVFLKGPVCNFHKDAVLMREKCLQDNAEVAALCREGLPADDGLIAEANVT